MQNAIVYLVLLALVVGIYLLVRRISGNNSRRRLQPVPVPVNLDRMVSAADLRRMTAPITVLDVPLINLVEAQVSAVQPRTARTIYRRLRKSGITMPFKVRTIEQMLKLLANNHHTVVRRRISGAKHTGYLAA